MYTLFLQSFLRRQSLHSSLHSLFRSIRRMQPSYSLVLMAVPSPRVQVPPQAPHANERTALLRQLQGRSLQMPTPTVLAQPSSRQVSLHRLSAMVFIIMASMYSGKKLLSMDPIKAIRPTLPIQPALHAAIPSSRKIFLQNVSEMLTIHELLRLLRPNDAY